MTERVSTNVDIDRAVYSDMLSQIEIALEESQTIDLSGDLEADVELSGPKADETLLGPLNPYERRVFVVQSLLGAAIEDFAVEESAHNAEKIADIVRTERVGPVEAAQRLAKNSFGKFPAATVNRLGVTYSLLRTTYEWSVRNRYGNWSSQLIVRSGFIVYAY